MIQQLIKIRILQTFRLLKDIGYLRVLFILLLAGLLMVMGLNFFKDPKNTSLSSVFTGLFLLAIHASRKDKKFLSMITLTTYPIFVAEYILITSPITVLWLFTSNWLGIGILVALCLTIPLIYLNLGFKNASSVIKFLINPFQSGLKARFALRIPFVSPLAFEWISGIRKNFIFLIPVYLFILSFSFKEFVGSVGYIFISVLISGFYFEGESRDFVELFSTSPKKFLGKKLGMNFYYMVLIFTPIASISMIFNPGQWLYLLAALSIGLLIQVFSIIFKYALFQENSNLNRNSLMVFMNIIFIIVPLFWPVPIIMGVRYYLKALSNLKIYFNVANK